MPKVKSAFPILFEGEARTEFETTDQHAKELSTAFGDRIEVIAESATGEAGSGAEGQAQGEQSTEQGSDAGDDAAAKRRGRAAPAGQA